jgi:hypothetical protein
LGLIMNEIYPSWFDGFKGAAMGIAFGWVHQIRDLQLWK